MTELQNKILGKLLDQHEKGKPLPDIKVTPTQIYKKWGDRYFDIRIRFALLDEMRQIEKKGLVKVFTDQLTGYLSAVRIVPEAIDECFHLLNRTKKTEAEKEDLRFLRSLSANTSLGKKYIKILFAQIENHKPIDHDRCVKFLRLIEFIADLDIDIYERELSQIIFGDTKMIEEKHRGAIADLLCELDPACSAIRDSMYSRDEINKLILERYRVIRPVSFIYIKGDGVIRLSSGRDITLFPDFAFAIPSEVIPQIEHIRINTPSVITIENLTAFSRIHSTDATYVFLGGYHNHAKQNLLVKMYNDNKQITNWVHAGDLDPDGVQILMGLRERTGIDFSPFLMEEDLLDRYKEYSKPLESNDVKLALKLKGKDCMPKLMDKMLSSGIKLEQEVVVYDKCTKTIQR